MRCDNCGSTDTYIKNHEHIYQIKGKRKCKPMKFQEIIKEKEEYYTYFPQKD